MLHFVTDNLWLTVASLESMDTGFDKGKLSVMAFLNNLLVNDFVMKCG